MEQLSVKEIGWLVLATKDNNRYHVSVDNDCISIDECIDAENDEWDSVLVFDRTREENCKSEKKLY